MEFRKVKTVKVHCIEGMNGFWVKITATEARTRPDAVRAKPKSKIAWFVPAELDCDVPDLNSIIMNEDL